MKKGLVKIQLHVEEMKALGKDQEIQIIEELAYIFRTYPSYIGSLFSADLVQWLTGQIKNDFPCDVMSALNYERAEHAETSKQLGEAQVRVGDLGREIKRLGEVADTWESRAKALSLASEHKGEALNLACDDVNRLTGENNRLKNELTNLKARLYDLEHA